MSRSYPIWVDVTACTYKSSKSYGAKEVNDQKILVGSSRTNSHELVHIVNYKRQYSEYGKHKEPVVVFKTKVDGITVKALVFRDNKGKAGELLETISSIS